MLCTLCSYLSIFWEASLNKGLGYIYRNKKKQKKHALFSDNIHLNTFNNRHSKKQKAEDPYVVALDTVK